MAHPHVQPFWQWLLTECVPILQELLADEQVAQLPVLILGNKIDKRGMLDAASFSSSTTCQGSPLTPITMQGR